jgi:predicted transcriptional regulator
VDVVASELKIDDTSDQDMLRLTADIVASYVSNNPIAPKDLQDLVKSVHGSLSRLGMDTSQVSSMPTEKQKPATPISRSIQNDHIVCLEDGKKLTMLKRYLRSRYDMSPEDYRRKWNLPPDYPMVAPAYASRRSEFAKSIGLGKGVRRKES